MDALILAAGTAVEATTAFPGDEFLALALVTMAIALITAAIATFIVTPGPDHH